jgi:ABC-type branched-subunit amino acid transport system ATPase component
MRSGASAASALLSVNNLEVVYDDVIQVLRGVSVSVPEGKIVALPGANCAGKTTLLRAITGLLDVHDGEITTGSVVFDAQPIHEQPPTRIAKPDQGAPSRVTDIELLSTGPTAKDYTFEKPCYQ